MSINKESIKQYLQDNGYTKIIFSPKGHEELWRDLPSNYPDFKVRPGEELPHDNFVNITHLTKVFDRQTMGSYWGHGGCLLKEIKEADNDFLTELFKWAQQEKVKRIEAEEQWEIVIHKKTQQDYQRDEAVKNWRVNRMANYARTCPYCNKQLGVVGNIGSSDSDKKIQLQHWESCSSCPEEIRTLVKKKLGELPLPQVNEITEYNRLTDLIKNSKDLEELEENWKVVKNSPLYDAKKTTFAKYGDYINNKKHFDGLYDTYKNSRGLKSRNNNSNNDNRERERERRISQLRSEIRQLEQIANRTSEQERELQEKIRELERLESQQRSGGGSGRDPKKPSNSWIWILVIVVIIVIVGGLIVWVWQKIKKKSNKF